LAGSYYDQDRTKRLLEISTADTADDTLLDELGAVADQHLDNILIAHDEKVPLTGGNILNDVKEMAALFTASIYKGKRGDEVTAKFFKDLFKDLLDGLALERAIEGKPFVVERFNSRYVTGQEDIFALW
jgi:hypothetical protein